MQGHAPHQFRTNVFTPRAKRLKVAHDEEEQPLPPPACSSPLWQRIDDISPRTRRMGSMAFSTRSYSSYSGPSSSSPGRTIGGFPSSPAGTMMASSPLKAEARWSKEYSRKRKVVEEEDVQEEVEDWYFDDALDGDSNVEDTDSAMEPAEQVDGLQLLLTAIERKESSAFHSQNRKQTPIAPAPNDPNPPEPEPEFDQSNKEEAVDISILDTSPAAEEPLSPRPTTPVSFRHSSLPPSSPLSAPPTPQSTSSDFQDQFDEEPALPKSPSLSRSASIPLPSSPQPQPSPAEPSSSEREVVTIKSEETADAEVSQAPRSPSPEPKPAARSPVKASPSRSAPKSPAKSRTEQEELNAELEGLIVTILAFGTKTSMTPPDIADAVINQNSQLVEKLSKSFAVLTESGANASKVDTVDEPKGKGKGKAKAKPKQTGKGKRGKRSGKANDAEFQAVLSAVDGVLKAGKMFGRIDRVGEDAAGDPLLPTFHYEADMDPDQDRAMTIQAAGVRTKRRATKHHVQYHWAPVSLNRFELAAECDDDD